MLTLTRNVLFTKDTIADTLMSAYNTVTNPMKIVSHYNTVTTVSLMPIKQSSNENIAATDNMTSFIIELILSVLIIVSNTVAIVICTREGNETVRVKVNDIVLSLAVADLCVGLTLPYHASFFFDSSLAKNRVGCFLRVSLTLQHVMASVLNLLLVTIDRYVAILHPYIYYAKGSLPKARLLIVLVWSYSVLVSSIIFFWYKGSRTSCALADIITPEFYATFWASPFFIASAIILVLYARIFIVAFKQEQRMICDISSNFQQFSGHRKIHDFKYAKVRKMCSRCYF